jgi:hypothetical protein
VLAEFDGLGSRVYHMLGNHCLYNLPRPQLNERLGIAAEDGESSFYAFSPHAGWLFVVLDGCGARCKDRRTDVPQCRGPCATLSGGLRAAEGHVSRGLRKLGGPAA